MPVYLFTFHAHGTWMPNRKQGYVQRKQGVLPPDDEMHAAYRRRATNPDVRFDDRVRPMLIDAVHEAATHQRLRVFGVATDPTHLHALIGWSDERVALVIRSNFKQSLTRRLIENHSQRVWFSRGGSQKPVVEREHFDHLVRSYLPRHVGPNRFPP